MLVEHQLLALRRLDDNEDTSRQHAIEAVTRVVLAKHDFTRRDAFSERTFQQLACFTVRQGAEQRVQAKQFLRGHPRIMTRHQATSPLYHGIGDDLCEVVHSSRALSRVSQKLASQPEKTDASMDGAPSTALCFESCLGGRRA